MRHFFAKFLKYVSLLVTDDKGYLRKDLLLRLPLLSNKSEMIPLEVATKPIDPRF